MNFCNLEATSACQKKAESEKELSSLSSDAKAASEEMVNALTSLTSVTGKVSIQTVSK